MPVNEVCLDVGGPIEICLPLNIAFASSTWAGPARNSLFLSSPLARFPFYLFRCHTAMRDCRYVCQGARAIREVCNSNALGHATTSRTTLGHACFLFCFFFIVWREIACLFGGRLIFDSSAFLGSTELGFGIMYEIAGVLSYSFRER